MSDDVANSLPEATGDDVANSLPEAIGGKVWSPQNAGGNQPRRVRFKKQVIEFIWHPIIIIPLGGLALLLMLTAAVLILESAEVINQDDRRMDSVYMQEYGYENVNKNYKDGIAQVTVAETGEVKEVNAVTYKEAFILYETRDQLDEKMDEVDAGTYGTEK